MTTQDNEIIEMIRQVDIDDSVNEEHRVQLRQRVLDRHGRGTPTAEPRSDRRPSPPRGFFAGRAARIAASIALLVAIGVMGYQALAPRQALAFADVAKAIVEIESVTFTLTAKTVSRENPDQRNGEDIPYKVFVQIPSHIRIENSDGTVEIQDLVRGQQLTLDTRNRSAKLFEFGPPDDAEIQKSVPGFFATVREHFQHFLNNENGKGEIKYTALGEKNIGGIKTTGFHIKNLTFPGMSIWSDSKTGLPVLIEQKLGIVDSVIILTMSDFAFNEKLDPSLFSMTPPEGYEVKTEKLDLDFSTPGEKDLLASLQLFAENSNGMFPDSLNPVEATSTITTRLAQKLSDEQALDQTREEARKATRPCLTARLFGA